MANIGWMLLFDNFDWLGVMKIKYLLGRVNYAFLVSDVLPRGSHVWNNLLKTKELLQKGIMLQIGNGSSIQFCKDEWSSPTPLKFLSICLAIESKLIFRFVSYVRDY
ncbi:hypothetical protein SUGI_1099160 [Cryptomeria japonica]|nr:hypothetical protein SUGI_1099160 [Cryptomeria japonica]